MDNELIARTAILARLQSGDPAQLTRSMAPEAQLTFQAVTRKKWRRSSLSEYSATDTLQKIQNALDNKRPLVFTIPFGGYKSWRVSSSPEPNWAEIFFVDYLRRYIRDISSAYPYGVRVEFTYVSGVMDIVSNHDPQWQPIYVRAMESLLAYYSDEPGQLSIVDIASLPGVDDLRLSVLRRYEESRHDWNLHALTEVQTRKFRSAERNFAIRGAHDFTHLDSTELGQQVHASAILCDALDSLADRRNYNKFGSRIQLVFDKEPQPAVHIGSCETSTVHFWVSEGMLESHGGRILPRLVGHSSLGTRESEVVLQFNELEPYRSRIGSWLPTNCRLI